MVLALWLAAALAGTVNEPVVNMYSRPTVDADVVSQAIYGSQVFYLEQQADWVKVQSFDKYSGWMEISRLKEAGSKAYASTGKTAWVSSLFAHGYREPNVTRHQPVITLPFESNLEIVAEPEGNGKRWLQVRLVDDRSAWVQRGDLSFALEKLSVDQAIELSKRFLGLPYTWGGTSSFGYDCSGFTQMLCRRQGVMLPRDAGPQAEWDGVKPVERTALQAGDLLYFGANAKKITHTGFDIGNGHFIHAAVSGRPSVQIGRLDDLPWTKLFICARRPK